MVLIGGVASVAGIGLLRIRMLLAIVALMFVRLPSPIGSQQEFPLRVLNDQSHEFTFRVHNGVRHFLGDERVTSTAAALNGDMLNPYDVVITSHFGGTEARYSLECVDLLTRFVAHGGGLVVLGCGWNPKCRASELAQAFGLELLTDRAKPPFEMGLQSMPPAEIQLGTAGTVAGGQAVIRCLQGAPVAALVSHGLGKVVVLNTPSFFDRAGDVRDDMVRRRYIGALLEHLGANRIGDRRLPMLETEVRLVPPENLLQLDGFVIRYSATLPEDRLTFLKERVPAVYELVTSEFGYGVTEAKEVWALMTDGGGFTASPRLIAIGVTAPDTVLVSTLVHEMSNSLCVEAPIWLGDAGWSKLVQIRVKTRMGGDFAADAERQRRGILHALHEYEQKHGPYDLVKGKDWSVGEGKLLTIVEELECQHGEGIMRRYFAAAQSPLGDRLKALGIPLDRRVFEYFNAAAGEDLKPYFRALGITVD